MLNIQLVQAHFVVGDIDKNTQDIIAHIHAATSAGADVVVLPELCVSGYPPEDLLNRASMYKRVAHALDTITQATGNVLALVGHPQFDNGQLYNAVSAIFNGKVLGVYRKQCLPNYGVFDEQRYFKAGTTSFCVTHKGVKMGILICEDIWEEQPIAALAAQDTQLCIVINASPFAVGKQAVRSSLLAKRAKAHNMAIAYVNLVAGQDDLVFDGGSMAVNSNGAVAVELPRFVEVTSYVEFDVAQRTFVSQKLPQKLSAEEEVYQALVVGLRSYVNFCGFKGVVLGLSGGIDSALSLAIAVDALGCKRVQAVMMPYQYTAGISMEDAALQAKRLGVSYHVIPIYNIVDATMDTLAPSFGELPPDTSEENIQARARALVLMGLSNKFNHMVLTTGNKSEMAVGYATLYGDMVGGYNALKDVYKTEVYRLAVYRNSLEPEPVIPMRVIERPPSAELRPGQTDQDSLPPYDVLDSILYHYIEKELSLDAMVALGMPAVVVKRIIGLVDRSEYKRKQAAPGVRISEKAFTRERRYPIMNGWKAGL